MDTAYGLTAPAVNADDNSIREYGLFQGILVVLHRLQAANPELDEQTLYEQCLTFQANPSLGFPGSDIDRVEYYEVDQRLCARMRLNLVSLFGASSPLPAFYAEQALGDNPQGNPTREFLDLFNDRLQRLLLPIWQKYRYAASFRPGANDAFSARLHALIGLGNEPLREASGLNWKRLLPYMGLLSLRVQSAAVMESVLRFYFQHARIHIEQCMERQVAIPAEQQSQLGGANSGLGTSLVLGQQVRDRSGKFRIHVQQLSWTRFHDFLPSGKDFAPLCTLVRFILRTPLDYDLQLQLAGDDIHPLGLARDNPCRLGWTSWLGLSNADTSVTLGSHPIKD
ncbi:MAG: type VI secretion system baseplate subunit TssG [Pseudomonadaceae bacterium]|nr:MAG: type VI secretion system baseplate subunit TssG [Pseudomonadaceae bacterium]